MSTPASTQVRRPSPRRRRLDASLIVGIALTLALYPDAGANADDVVIPHTH